MPEPIRQEKLYGKPSQSEGAITIAELNDVLNVTIVSLMDIVYFHRLGIFTAYSLTWSAFKALFDETFLEIEEHMKQEDYITVKEYIDNPMNGVDWSDTNDPENEFVRPQLVEKAKKVNELYYIYQKGMYDAKLRCYTKPKVT